MSFGARALARFALKAYPQSSIEEIVDIERAMLGDGEARYGRVFRHALRSTVCLALCVETIDADPSDIFGRLFSLLKIHELLALLSSLRLHHVQAMMNLRHVFEVGAASAYCVAIPEVADFVDIDEFVIMEAAKGLTVIRYKPVADLYCASCQEEFELKSQKARFGARIADGAYRTMRQRLEAHNNPNLMLVNYSVASGVSNLFVVPKHFFVTNIIEERKPLANTARRAGWVGCNILLSHVPDAEKSLSFGTE